MAASHPGFLTINPFSHLFHCETVDLPSVKHKGLDIGINKWCEGPDTALYHAKEQGWNNYQIYSGSICVA